MFKSILNREQATANTKQKFAATYQDLHLDQLFDIFQAATRQSIKTYFYQPLTDWSAIKYRQNVFRDLADVACLTKILQFERQFRCHDDFITEIASIYDNEVKWYELLIIQKRNFAALHDLQRTLQNNSVKSQALLDLADYLNHYLQAAEVTHLQAEIDRIFGTLQQLHYRLIVDGLKITVEETTGFESGLDDAITTTFASLLATDDPEINHGKIKKPEGESDLSNLQAMILRALGQVFPKEFHDLRDFYEQYIGYADATIDQVANELNFYLAVIKVEQHVAKTQQTTFCYPDLAATGQDEQVTASFDLTLAAKNHQQIVTNDYLLKANEQFLIISGPNQGGKTTYARMVGENYYLFTLGVPIPGQQATLHLRQQVWTHFERQENERLLTGLLAADVDRIWQIAQASGPDSFVIMNELFSSTTVEDAEEMAKKVLLILEQRGAHGIYVTFLEQLNTLPATASMMSQVVPNSTTRSFKVIRTAPNGRAYAVSLLQAYHLTAAQIKAGETNES